VRLGGHDKHKEVVGVFVETVKLVKCCKCGELTDAGFMTENGACYCDECAPESEPTREFRVCVHCGKPMTAGMTDFVRFYVHEGCFADAMGERYATWREVEDDGCDGYYEWYDPRENEWCGTGIFYTEWD